MDEVLHALHDIIDAGRSRPFPEPRPQSDQLLGRTHGHDFHAAVVIIANASGNAQQVRLALDKPAKTHALHAPANDEATSLWIRGMG